MLRILCIASFVVAATAVRFNEPNLVLHPTEVLDCNPSSGSSVRTNIIPLFLIADDAMGFTGTVDIRDVNLKWTYQMKHVDKSQNVLDEGSESEKKELSEICNTPAWRELHDSGTIGFGCPFRTGDNNLIAYPLDFDKFFPEEHPLQNGENQRHFIRFYQADNTLAGCIDVGFTVKTAQEEEARREKLRH